jgi:hypothetical protein
MLEAGTIVGRPGEKLRVAVATQERKIVKNITRFYASNTSLFWKDLIREFTHCIFVPNYFN